jgi:CRP/FNR family transcriptional regulator
MRSNRLGKEYQGGEVIFREGDKGEAMYVIQSGEVVLTKKTPSGEYTLACLGAGEILGEMALFDKKPRSATATAAGPARLLSVDKHKLFESVSNDPTLLFRILETGAGRLRKIGDELTTARKLIAAFLETSASLEETCRMIMEEGKEVVQAENGSLMFLDDSETNLAVTAAFGAESDLKILFKPGEGIAGRVLLSGKAERIDDVSGDPDYVKGNIEIQSLLCAPLKNQGMIFGVINMSRTSGQPFDGEDLRVLTSLANFASIAVHNALHFSRIHSTMRKLSIQASLLDL